MTAHNYLRWTPQDDLVVLAIDLSIAEKAKLLGRTYDAVIVRRQRMRMAGISVPRTYIRSAS